LSIVTLGLGCFSIVNGDGVRLAALLPSPEEGDTVDDPTGQGPIFFEGPNDADDIQAGLLGGCWCGHP